MPKEIPKPSVLGGRLSAVPVSSNAAVQEPAPAPRAESTSEAPPSEPKAVEQEPVVEEASAEAWTKVTLEVPVSLAEEFRDAAWAMRTKCRAKDVARAFFVAGLELLRKQENKGKKFPKRPRKESLQGGRALKLNLS